MSEAPKYWFNSKTKQVELGLKSPSQDRIGPFDTETEAAGAEALLRARAEAWSAEDRAEDREED